MERECDQKMKRGQRYLENMTEREYLGIIEVFTTCYSEFL